MENGIQSATQTAATQCIRDSSPPQHGPPTLVLLWVTDHGYGLSWPVNCQERQLIITSDRRNGLKAGQDSIAKHTSKGKSDKRVV